MNKKFLWKKGSSIIFITILLAAGVFPFISSSIALNEVKIEKLTSPLGNDWWSMFRHDTTHSGFSAESAPADNDLLWSYQTNYTVQSSPAVSHGRLYVGSWDWSLYCLDMDSGALLWNYTTDSQISSPPAVVNGRVYFGSEDYKLYCLDAISGAFLWSFKTNFLVDASPIVVDGAVFFSSSDGGLYCLNADDGSLLWDYQTGSVILSSPAVAEGKVYIGISYVGFQCLDSLTGSIIWSYPMQDGIYSSPTIDEGKVYFGSNDKNVYCLNANDGSLVWNYSALNEVHSSPAIAYGKLYIGISDGSVEGRLLCLDKNTGAFQWDYQVWGGVEGSPAVADGKVFFGSDPCCGFPSYLFCVDALTGQEIWQYDFNSQNHMKSSPVVAAGKVFIGSPEDEVFAFGDIEYIADANGPYFSGVNIQVQFTGSVYGGQPQFSWSWDFGDGATSTEQSPAHTYAEVGQYFVTLTVTDGTGSVATDGTQVSVKMPNQIPSTPVIEGPTNGKMGISYNYTFVSTDPDGDNIYYWVDWGEPGCPSVIQFGPYPSGHVLTLSYTYTTKGTFTIGCQAEDINGATSDWGTLSVTMPRSKASVNDLFLRFFECFPNAFPLLRHLMGL